MTDETASSQQAGPRKIGIGWGNFLSKMATIFDKQPPKGDRVTVLTKAPTENVIDGVATKVTVSTPPVALVDKAETATPAANLTANGSNASPAPSADEPNEDDELEEVEAVVDPLARMAELLDPAQSIQGVRARRNYLTQLGEKIAAKELQLQDYAAIAANLKSGNPELSADKIAAAMNDVDVAEVAERFLIDITTAFAEKRQAGGDEANTEQRGMFRTFIATQLSNVAKHDIGAEGVLNRLEDLALTMLPNVEADADGDGVVTEAEERRANRENAKRAEEREDIVRDAFEATSQFFKGDRLAEVIADLRDSAKTIAAAAYLGEIGTATTRAQDDLEALKALDGAMPKQHRGIMRAWRRLRLASEIIRLTKQARDEAFAKADEDTLTAERAAKAGVIAGIKDAGLTDAGLAPYEASDDLASAAAAVARMMTRNTLRAKVVEVHGKTPNQGLLWFGDVKWLGKGGKLQAVFGKPGRFAQNVRIFHPDNAHVLADVVAKRAVLPTAPAAAAPANG